MFPEVSSRKHPLAQETFEHILGILEAFPEVASRKHPIDLLEVLRIRWVLSGMASRGHFLAQETFE